MRLRALSVLSVTCLFAVGCGGGGGSSANSGNSSSIVVNVSPARADVNAGGTFVLDSFLTGDTSGQGIAIALQGVGSITTLGPDFFGSYSTLYNAPGSPVAVNPTSLVGTSASITVTSKANSSKTVTVPITLHDNIQLPAQTPPGAFVGKAYTYSFTASGGTGTLSFALLSTSGPLPAGLTLSAGGVLSGTPTTMGSYTFGVLVTDQATKVVGFARTFSLQVN